MSEDAQEEDSTNDEYDQDKSISFEDDAESTSSHEDELEDWIEYIKKRSAREGDEKMLTHKFTNWVETQKNLKKWRQAVRIATESPDRWTRKAAEWSPGLIISLRSQRKAGRPAKRWEDDQNGFVKDEEAQTQSNELQDNCFEKYL